MNKKDICENLCPESCIDKEIICQWMKDINNYIEQQIENLKCCGNCKFLVYEHIGRYFNCENNKSEFFNSAKMPYNYCEHRQTDGLTQEERK